MKAAILDFFHVPEAVRSEFWREVLQKNHLSLVVICIMILGMELYNMARVLLWSSSGLGTLNNRIYFGFYASLFLSAILCLLLEHALRQAAPMRRWAAQYGSMLFFFLWHAVLNAYDLMRDPYGSTGIFVTAVLALAVFIHMPWTFSIPAYGLAYGLFFLLAGKHLAGGDLLNLTFTTIVSLAVSLTTSRNLVIMVSQRRQIDEANAQLQELLERDPLTGLLNKVAFQSCAERILEDGERGQDLTLLLLDLDDFKGINDHYGHPCGDDVLVHTAQALRQVFPEAAGIGRVGGDEFAVLLRDRAEGASERIGQGCSRRWPGSTGRKSRSRSAAARAFAGQTGSASHTGPSMRRPTRPCTRPKGRERAVPVPACWTESGLRIRCEKSKKIVDIPGELW